MNNRANLLRYPSGRDYAGRFMSLAPRSLNARPSGRRLPLARVWVGGLFAAALAFPVSAQTVCNTRDHITKQLERKYGETQRGAGSIQGHSVAELWVSTETGTWTILVTNRLGISCVMASGEGWEDARPKEPEERT